MKTKYKLYKKTSDTNVIAAVSNHATIDNIILHIFTNTAGTLELTTYKEDAMKLGQPGRPLWSEITWTPSKKWKLLSPAISIDVEECVVAINSGKTDEAIQLLTAQFDT